MQLNQAPIRKPHWYLIPVRVLLVSFLLTLLSFAVSLLLAIVGVAVSARLRSVPPDMTVAYRLVAAPVAVVVGGASLLTMVVVEIRRYQQAKTLAALERSV